MFLTVEIRTGSKREFICMYKGDVELGVNELHSTHPKHVCDDLLRRAQAALANEFRFDGIKLSKCWKLIREIEELDPSFKIENTRFFDQAIEQVCAGLESGLRWRRQLNENDHNQTTTE